MCVATETAVNATENVKFWFKVVLKYSTCRKKNTSEIYIDKYSK